LATVIYQYNAIIGPQPNEIADLSHPRLRAGRANGSGLCAFSNNKPSLKSDASATISTTAARRSRSRRGRTSTGTYQGEYRLWGELRTVDGNLDRGSGEISDARLTGPFDAGLAERTAMARRRALKFIIKLPVTGKQHHATAAEG
jgi:hypothetical protein